MNQSYPKIVAHRGNASSFTENTMAAFKSAVELGCKYIELDVQMTYDLVPIVYHDETLNRLHGHDLDVRHMTLAQIKHIDQAIPTLSEVTQWLETCPDVTLFVELKEESIDTVGRMPIISAVLDACRAVLDRVVFISFDFDIITQLEANNLQHRLGWVLPPYSTKAHGRIAWLLPEFVFCDIDRLAEWNANMQRISLSKWVVYEIGSVDDAAALSADGIEYVETMQVEKLIRP